MTTPTATMSTIMMVPFSRLIAHDGINARADTKDGLDELAASIAARGLIQPLAVRAAEKDGSYDVIDGRRRYRALALLVKAKTLAKSFSVPVIVRTDDDIAALETSLAANTVRLPMHPIDQHEVFARLIDQGRTEPEIAASFGIAERTVKQQLALGRLAPAVRKAWRAGTIDARAAQAFTVHADHGVQTATLADLKKQASYGGLSEGSIKRRLLGQNRAPLAQCKELVFVGVDAYLAAGGTLTDSLFDEDRFVDDVPLVETLVARKLEAMSIELVGNGWAWATVEDGAKYSHLECAHVRGADADEPEDIADYTPEERARSGCLVSFNEHTGEAEIYAGLLRTSGEGQTDLEDAITEAGSEDDTFDGDTTGDDAADGDNGDDAAALGAEDHCADVAISQALQLTLSEIDTQATAAALAADPVLALRVITAALTCRASGPAVVRNDGHASVRERHDVDFATSLARTHGMNATQLLPLLATAVATTLDLTTTRWGFRAPTTTSAVRGLVSAVPGEVYTHAAREHFLPGDYFKRAPKGLALAAIGEMREAGHGANLAPLETLMSMKKSDLATAAADAAEACGWLPPELRHHTYSLGIASAAAGGQQERPVGTGQPKGEQE